MSRAILPWRAFGQLGNSRFLRNVLVVASGTAGAQAMTVAASPLITRLYGPDAFGLFGLFMSLMSIAAPLAALSFPMAIALPKDDRDALGLIRLSAMVSLGTALFFMVATWIAGDWISKSLGVEAISAYLLFIPVAMLFSGWVQTFQQWLIRKHAFGDITRCGLVHSFCVNLSKVGVGVLHPVAGALMATAVVGHAFHAWMLWRRAGFRRSISLNASQGGAGISCRELACRYRDFPVYRTPQNVINAISQAFPVIFLAVLFDPSAAGFYTLGKMVMGMPSSLLGKAVGDVFYPRIIEVAHQGGDLARHILKATAALLAVGVVPFGLVVLYGPWLFASVFGAEWEVSGEYARWLAVFFLFNFINKPAVAVVPVLKAQCGLLFYEVLSSGAKVLGVVIGAFWLSSAQWAVAIFSIVGVLAYIAMMLWIYRRAAAWGGYEETGR